MKFWVRCPGVVQTTADESGLGQHPLQHVLLTAKLLELALDVDFPPPPDPLPKF